MHLLKRWLFLLFWYILEMKWTEAEVYTAIVDMESLLKTEFILMETLQNYIQQQENKLNLLKRQVALYQIEYKKSQKDPTEYLANPINAYLLVKRLTTDWKNTENLLKNDIYQEMTNNLTHLQEEVKFPTDEDLSGAAVALTRLQDTYNLDTQSIARGELNGVKYSTELSADDCFELGRQSYFNEDFYHTVLWMREALRKHDVEQNNTNTFKWEILEYLAFSVYMQGNVRVAAKLTEELLSMFPNHERAKGNLVYYRNMIKSEEESKKKKGEDEDPENMVNDEKENIESLPPQSFTSIERAKYEMLCRNEIDLPHSIGSKLKCRYVNKGKPYLLIAPLKEEEAYLDPRIVLYREVISDAEIDLIKTLAKPRLKRATVQNHKTGELEVAHYRISKSAWLKDSDHPVVAAVRRRVEDISSLTVETAEELQVVNYGIGGHYEPHFDFARKDEVNAFKSLGTGNRIATALFYMSDVKQGGATVFPPLKLALWPEKGTVAFWHNLHTSGVGNEQTRHAACPVLTGSKWVSNVWLHESGQEFLRPCDPSDPNRDYS